MSRAVGFTADQASSLTPPRHTMVFSSMGWVWTLVRHAISGKFVGWLDRLVSLEASYRDSKLGMPRPRR